MKLDLLVRDGLICREDLPPARGAIGVRDGRIAVVAAGAEGLDATDVIDAAGRLVMPGMIDPHIHIGHGAPHASEFWTEGRPAVVGGVTRRRRLQLDQNRGVSGVAAPFSTARTLCRESVTETTRGYLYSSRWVPRTTVPCAYGWVAAPVSFVPK